MPSLKVETVSFQMIIILRRLTIKQDFIEKQILESLIHGHPVHLVTNVYVKLSKDIRYKDWT